GIEGLRTGPACKPWTVILDRLNEPIVLAPLAGGASTPELTAAVSEAGGFGFLAGGYLSPDQLGSPIGQVRALTHRPFGVNLFVPGDDAVDEEAVSAYLDRIAGEATARDAELGAARYDDDAYDAKLSVLESLRPEVASFTFGRPEEGEVESLQARGM